jgi:hypothetical protein
MKIIFFLLDSDTQTRLFKSLVTIICVNIGGYLVNIFFIGLYIAQLQQRLSIYSLC